MGGEGVERVHEAVGGSDVVGVDGARGEEVCDGGPAAGRGGWRGGGGESGEPHAGARHRPPAVLVPVRRRVVRGRGLDAALRPVVADARGDDGTGAGHAPHAQPTQGLGDLQQHDDAPPGLLPRALGEHLEEQLRVLDRPQQGRAPRVDPTLGRPEPFVAALRGEGGRGEEVRVVGCEEGEEGLQRFGREGRVGEAGSREEVGEGAEGGFEGGDLGGVVPDEGLVGGEPL